MSYTTTAREFIEQTLPIAMLDGSHHRSLDCVVKFVIDGELTLGMMLSISYIIGQLDSPVGQIVGFIYKFQDARIALERLSEIHNREDEDQHLETGGLTSAIGDIDLENITFKYQGRRFRLTDIKGHVVKPLIV